MVSSEWACQQVCTCSVYRPCVEVCSVVSSSISNDIPVCTYSPSTTSFFVWFFFFWGGGGGGGGG